MSTREEAGRLQDQDQCRPPARVSPFPVSLEKIQVRRGLKKGIWLLSSSIAATILQSSHPLLSAARQRPTKLKSPKRSHCFHMNQSLEMRFVTLSASSQMAGHTALKRRIPTWDATQGMQPLSCQQKSTESVCRSW